MAEGALFTIAGGIIKSLAPLVANEIGLLWGVQNELEKLQDTVSTIKDVLLDAEEKRAGSRPVSNWLGKLSDLFYEADDLLDAISTEARRQEIMTRGKKIKKVRIFFSKSNQLVSGLRMGHKIKEIREKLDAVKGDRPFILENRHEETRVRDWRRDNTYSHLGAEEVVGREDDKMAVISRLRESKVEGNVSIVAIVGLGGLGKTTVAQLIFNDVEIQNNFKLKIWVCISDNFDFKAIITKILECITKKKPKTDLMERLLSDLRKEIEGKKFFLVLDDVWNEDGEKWSKLKNQLMICAKDSKILITTRNENVARIMHAEPYHLGELGEDASWELFKQVAFNNGIGPENLSIEKMEKIKRKILKSCLGVPLVVIMVGRLLFFRRTKIEWENFINEELSKLPLGVINIFTTLKLSYNDLPLSLKHCFAYCSLFPKDYEFDKEILINLWIAQGYVESEENQCLEDIGNEYFMNLLWRSFFQEVRKDRFGNIIGCKMHDLMHDLAILVAEPLIISFPSKNSINSKRTLHVAITYDISSFAKMSPLYKANRIRTFLCPIENETSDQVKIDCEIILKSSKFLRVLDLSKRKFKHLPSSISKLKHLRYLDLSWNKKIKKLPISITSLVNLQNLCLHHCFELKELPNFEKLVNLRHFDVSQCSKLRSLPKNITKLVNMRHLNIDGCWKIKYFPSGISQLTNLQFLTDFAVNSDSFPRYNSGLAELNSLNKLKGHLTIWALKGGKGVLKEYKAANLLGKENLNSLSLKWSISSDANDWDNDVSMESLQPHQNLKCLKLCNYHCPRNPSWLSSLTSLVWLSLKECSKWRVLESLSHLSSLQSLRLNRMNDLEYICCGDLSDYSLSSAPTTFFPSLKEIDLGYCQNLKAWWGHSSPEIESLLPLLLSMRFFPSLTALTVRECPNLEGWWRDSSAEVENWLYSFPLLSEVNINGCPSLTSMPILPLLKESYLMCTNDSWKSLRQILMMSVSVTIASSPLAVSLCTHLSKLKEIEFYSVSDLEALPEEGLQSLTSLEDLWFFKCDKLKSLSPGIQHLTTVQRLHIEECPVFTDDGDGGMQWQCLKSLFSLSFLSLPKLSSLPLGFQYVTTLETLSIQKCERFMTLSPLPQHVVVVEQRDISACSMCIDDENGLRWQSLRCLLSLSFSNLPQWSSLPLGLQHVTTLQNLEISKCENLMTLSPAIQSLKNLLTLSFHNLPKLSSLLPDLQHVTTLRKLKISSCESLTALSSVVKHFPAVDELYIENCPMRVDDKDEMQWQCFKNLLFLSFCNLPKLSSLPLGLKYVTTLRELKISRCNHMRTIPKWIRQCKSLEMLTILDCSNLKSLPFGSREPWSLQKLDIQYCPILLQKCEREKGEYWAKIAHIADLNLQPPPISL